MEHLDARLVLAFLEHLERDRSNSARTRNARLAALNALFRFLEYRLASCLDQSRQIHAIPMQKTDEALVAYLTRDELQALLDAPDPRIMSGARDRAMLHLAFAAGLRVSELVALRLDQLDLEATLSIHVVGNRGPPRALAEAEQLRPCGASAGSSPGQAVLIQAGRGKPAPEQGCLGRWQRSLC